MNISHLLACKYNELFHIKQVLTTYKLSRIVKELKNRTDYSFIVFHQLGS
jgi:hypothetical protein